MHLECKNALVTGGAGFIGSHLVEALLSCGCKVTVLDNLSSGHLLNLKPVMDQIAFYQNDIREPEMLEKAAEGCDVIFHLAAVVAVQQTINNPVESTIGNENDPPVYLDLPDNPTTGTPVMVPLKLGPVTPLVSLRMMVVLSGPIRDRVKSLTR